MTHYISIFGLDTEGSRWGGNDWYEEADLTAALGEALRAFLESDTTGLCTLEITIADENSPKKTVNGFPLPVNHGS